MHYSGEVKAFTFLYDKFTEDNMHQILSESVNRSVLYRRNDKNISGVFFFGSQCISDSFSSSLCVRLMRTPLCYGCDPSMSSTLRPPLSDVMHCLHNAMPVYYLQTTVTFV